MNIKNLNVIKKPDTKSKLCALSLAGLFTLTMMGCGSSNEATTKTSPNEITVEPSTNSTYVQYSPYYKESTEDLFSEKTFAAGELNLFVFDRMSTYYGIIQGINVPEGFEIADVMVMSTNKGLMIRYTNIIDISIKQYVDKEGNNYYRDFGTPIKKPLVK